MAVETPVVWAYTFRPADDDGPRVFSLSTGVVDDSYSVRCEVLIAERPDDNAWYFEAYGRPIEGDLERDELDVSGFAGSLADAESAVFAAVTFYNASQKATIVADAEVLV